MGSGKAISEEELTDIFLKLQEERAENINLVSPTIYIDKIIKAIKKAKKQGLNLPIIYNSNGYEKIESLKKLEGIVDVYLPDLKYSNNELALQYSKVKNYFETATSAIEEMARQVGKPKFNERGMIQKGLIIRHLIIPNHIENTKKCLKWIKENLPSDIYVSIMTQYFPTHKASNYPKINRKITEEEYSEIEDYIQELNIQNGYMQDFVQEDESKYVPVFNI